MRGTRGLRRSKGLIIDTNLLLLYIVGSLDPNLIRKHKRTSQFGIEDFRLLDDFLGQFERFVTTPNVLTEVSNLLSQIGDEVATRLRIRLRALIEIFQEEYIASTEAAGAEEFQRLGLTDAAILLLSKEDLLVLTDDIHLYLALQRRGIEAVNFNYIREASWRQ
jgi:rRNA-processing protein FCF1